MFEILIVTIPDNVTISCNNLYHILRAFLFMFLFNIEDKLDELIKETDARIPCGYCQGGPNRGVCCDRVDPLH